MKKILTKVLATVLALVLLATALPMVFSATEVASGTAGEGITWVLDSDGTLTISGNGAIEVDWGSPPWYAHNGSILNVVIEEGITELPGTLLNFADKCVSVSIPASAESINGYAFPFTSALEKFIVDENNPNYKSVDGILFSKDGKTLVFFPNNYGITEYTVPDTVETLSDHAFLNNVCLKKVTVPGTVASIEESAFYDADIEKISLGNGITNISENVFNWAKIQSIVIPDTVKTIGYSMFWGCDYLETILIGSGIESIGYDILCYTDSLSSVHYNGTQEDWDNIDIHSQNADLFAKELHFVSQKEGVDPTCADGHSAGLYCSECDEYFTGEIIPAVKAHVFNGDNVCDSCGFVCEHPAPDYIRTAETHQLKCNMCGVTNATQSHRIVNYQTMDGEKCIPYCDDCGLVEAAAKPHSMTSYGTFDSENCILYCTDCGYGDEEAGFVPHLMTAYETYDDEYCIKVCERCSYGNAETGLVKHSYDNGTLVPATDTESENIKYTCKNCNHSYRKYNTENSIVFKLFSNDESGAWEECAILVYVNGKPVTLVRNMTGSDCDIFAMPYDKNSSYVFKWIDGAYCEAFGAEIYLPDSEDAVFDETDMSYYDMLQTIYAINVADYSDVDDALVQIPDYLEWYSADSVAALVTAVKGVERMLPAGKQAEVDAMAAAIENAVDGLVELEDPVPNGVINMSAGNYLYINDSYFSEKPSYTHFNSETGDNIFYEYEGKYVILETQPKDEGNEDYVHYGISTYTGEVEFDLVNTFITGYFDNFNIFDDSDVTLNLFGANAFACYYWEDDDVAGIEIEEDAKLHIKDSKGSLVAIGQDDQAGIGSEEDEDIGEITIDGGTIFALSLGDGAGIGGGYEGGAGKITINSGTIWAECMSDDGAGIGVGDDGYGGEIIINGGDITALSLDDDGAGIGGADEGYIDSITINGGNIVAGSEDGAAIGGGQEAESFGGKITINGGKISASEWHNNDENLIGNGSSNSKGESKDNFVQINGGRINTSNSKGISPAPKDKNGNVLEEKKVTVHDSLIGKEITIELSNGSKITVTADDNEISVYAPKDASVSNETELETGYCNHICHQDGFMGFLWKIFIFFSKLFGTNPVCECGKIHY